MVRLDEELILDVALQLSAVEEPITVTAETPLIESTKAEFTCKHRRNRPDREQRRRPLLPARDFRRLGSGQTTHDAVLEPARIATVSIGSSPEYIAAFEAGDLPQTIEILTTLVGHQPDFGPAHLLLARSHYELEHWVEAIAGYKRVIELEPGVPVAYLDLGVALSQVGDLDSAAGYFEKAVSMQPDDATVYYNVSAIFVRADRVDEAIEYLTRATELDPEAALAHKALAFALVRNADSAAAAVHLERYLEIEPEAADAAEMAALLEQLLGS